MDKPSSPPLILEAFSKIAPCYDCLISDVWGVLHNGRDAYLPAAEALARFREQRGPVILLSNAPRLADGVEAMFDRVGLRAGFYDGIVTSGSATRARLRCLTEGREAPIKVFYLGPPRDNPLFHGLSIRFVGPEAADVVVCTGLFDDEKETPEDYRSLLGDFRARALPFLCANPDIVVQRGERLVPCAGAIARLYEEIGGEVHYFGKPYPAVFEAALAEARKRQPFAHPLVIGDNLDTDILGAHRLKLPALFVMGGVHGKAFRDPGLRAEGAFASTPGTVVAVMPALRW